MRQFSKSKLLALQRKLADARWWVWEIRGEMRSFWAFLKNKHFMKSKFLAVFNYKPNSNE